MFINTKPGLDLWPLSLLFKTTVYTFGRCAIVFKKKIIIIIIIYFDQQLSYSLVVKRFFFSKLTLTGCSTSLGM